MTTNSERKAMGKKQTAMANAAIAMLEAEAYDCGGDDRWVFAGRHEAGCGQLVDAGFCTRHPKGLLVYSRICRTLTSDGSVVAKCAYRLTQSGKEYAERMKAAKATARVGAHP